MLHKPTPAFHYTLNKQGMALLHSKSKKRKGQKSGEATGEATPSATGRMHIDLASDLIQVR